MLLLGDLNRAVGSDQFGVTGNSDKVSQGGQLVRDMVKDKNLVVLNNLEGSGPGLKEVTILSEAV